MISEVAGRGNSGGTSGGCGFVGVVGLTVAMS